MSVAARSEGAGVQWDAALYGANSGHHRVFDSVFLDSLEVRRDSAILDLGCGTGELTARLASMAGDGRVVGIDASRSMIDEARRRHDGVEFVELPAQDLSRALGRFDLVVSTAVLHWVPSLLHTRVLRNVHDVLLPTGVFRAEFGGRGQIAAARRIMNEELERLHMAVRPSWYFPAPAAYLHRLVTAGFDQRGSWVHLRHQRRPLADVAALRGWLRSQVTIAYTSAMNEADAEAFVRSVEARAEVELRRDDGSYDQDYVRTDLLAVPQGAN